MEIQVSRFSALSSSSLFRESKSISVIIVLLLFDELFYLALVGLGRLVVVRVQVDSHDALSPVSKAIIAFALQIFKPFPPTQGLRFVLECLL